MNRYVAPLGFTLAAAWVVVLFMLVRATPWPARSTSRPAPIPGIAPRIRPV